MMTVAFWRTPIGRARWVAVFAAAALAVSILIASGTVALAQEGDEEDMPPDYTEMRENTAGYIKTTPVEGGIRIEWNTSGHITLVGEKVWGDKERTILRGVQSPYFFEAESCVPYNFYILVRPHANSRSIARIPTLEGYEVWNAPAVITVPGIIGAAPGEPPEPGRELELSFQAASHDQSPGPATRVRLHWIPAGALEDGRGAHPNHWPHWAQVERPDCAGGPYDLDWIQHGYDPRIDEVIESEFGDTPKVTGHMLSEYYINDLHASLQYRFRMREVYDSGPGQWFEVHGSPVSLCQVRWESCVDRKTPQNDQDADKSDEAERRAKDAQPPPEYGVAPGSPPAGDPPPTDSIVVPIPGTDSSIVVPIPDANPTTPDTGDEAPQDSPTEDDDGDSGNDNPQFIPLPPEEIDVGIDFGSTPPQPVW